MHAIYRTVAEPLYRYLLRLTLGDRETAEDLLQETLLRAWRNIDRLPADLESARPWLFTVARNHAIDIARARKVRPAELSTMDVSRIAAPADAVEQLVAAETVRRALLTLSEEHRVVLVELYLREASAAEAAARIGIPEGTVKSRAHYALRFLRATLDTTER
ncbi:MAG TPA: sigma-70 family RNA polymerase sigma factor [Pseudonocardiaceae bacterium]|nr:sigma-70 family RNA polymerase sigma factor [Pseudonocardiaceae bacterium]